MALAARRQNQVAEDEPMASRFLVLREDSFGIRRIGPDQNHGNFDLAEIAPGFIHTSA